MLLPGKPGDPIRCELELMPLDDVRPYEAVSYVWGRTTDRVVILCHGKKLKITRNLFEALKRFRRRRKTRILWADAVCINQSDLGEREHQVQSMGKVFEQAERVLVWLGLGQDLDPGALFHFIRELAKDVPRSFDAKEIDRFMDSLPQDHESWTHFRTFFQNPWFYRMWIIQEIGLGREALVHCGDATVMWASLDTLCCCLFQAMKRRTYRLINFSTGIGRVVTLGRRSFLGFRKHHVTWIRTSHILDYSRMMLCSDDRDRVYALLGHTVFRDSFSNHKSKFYLPVDYTISCNDLYTSVATKDIQISRERPYYILLFLAHNDHTIHDCDNITSWAPQWNVLGSPKCLGQSRKMSFNAHGQTLADFSFTDKILRVHGFQFDTITWISDIFELGCLPHDPSEALDILNPHPLAQTWNYLSKMGFDSSEGLEAMCMTLIGGGLEHDLGSTQRKDVKQVVADVQVYFEGMGIPMPGVEDYARPGSLFQFWQREICENRRFFMTSRGWIGIGPRVISVGHEVCIFFGGDTPFVLMEMPSASESIYRLCGECYVHGIMHGEAIEMWESGQLEEKTFNLI